MTPTHRLAGPLTEPAATDTAAAPKTRPFRRSTTWLVVLGFWTFPGLLIASQLYFVFNSAGRGISWVRLGAWQVLTWYFWAFASVAILDLCRRLPISRERWGRVTLAHVGLAILASLLHIGYAVLVTKAIAPTPYSEFTLNRIFGFFLFQGVQLDLLIYCGILGIGYGTDYYRRYQERALTASQLEAQLAQAQLQALRMQLHPHFLFNTLNAISATVRKNANPQAIKMLAGLSGLLRTALDNVGTQEVTLEQELDFVERYLELEQIRFQDRLQIRIDIAPEALRAQVPNLILQPLVENSIRHGISRKATAGRLEIRASLAEDRLLLEVRDDGPGLPGGSGSASRSGGIGLTNTRARLQQLYGDRHHFSIENAEGGGALVRIEIPFRQVD